MRLPKRVLINNVPFRVEKNPKCCGSNLSYRNLKIQVGTRDNSQREILTGFLHECAEISMVERGMRATKDKPQDSAGEYVFHGSHKDFTDVVSDISGVVANLMKLE